ncbi:MAG: response regulator [Chloroflexota bacterium]
MPKPLALVVEDQINLVTLYEDVLRLVGYDVHSIQDGLKALNYLETNDTPPTLIILDVNLPSLSGQDLHAHIRKNDKYANTPVLILTANSLMAERIKPKITEKDHLYIKPVSVMQLQSLAKSMRPDPNAQRKTAHERDTDTMPITKNDAPSTEPTDNPIADTDVLRPDDTRSHEEALSSDAQAIVEDTVLQPNDTVTASSASSIDSTDKAQSDETVLKPENE